MSEKTVVIGIALIVILSASIIAGMDWQGSVNSTPEFFVGVEFAYGDVSDLKSLVDKVKNYTNLFVIGLPEISFDQIMLNETCDYIYDAGLYFIVFFTATTDYPHVPYVWIMKAKQKYGDKLLAVYRYDEPGGNVLDDGASTLLNKTKEYSDYADAANSYVDVLNGHIEYFLYSGADVLTADYGLYWFDYKGGYDAVLAEFGSNQSRARNIALCRGAAKAQNKDWGVIITWEYNYPPYIESENELYDDMVLAYKAGAKYMVIFDYPKTGQYGILTEDHFKAMKNFWNYTQSNPQEHGVNKGEVAYVLPQDYGFGFRNPRDTIWGVWNADDLSQKVWDDAKKLIAQYDSRLDIVYDDPEFITKATGQYDKLFFWNETIT